MGTFTVTNVKDAPFSAVGNGIADDTEALQDAIDAASAANGVVYLPAGIYLTSAPLMMPAGGSIVLLGDSSARSIIRKGTNDPPDNPITRDARGSTVEDDYDVDSIISIDHPDNGYCDNVRVENLALESDTEDGADYAFFAPRSSRIVIRNVFTLNCNYGFYTYESWLSVIESFAASDCVTALCWKDDGSGGGTGTSLTATRVSAVARSGETGVGYDFYGIAYSTFNSCAIDGATGEGSIAYKFDVCRGITLNSCGAEDIVGEVLKLTYTVGVVNGFRTWNIRGNGGGGSHAYLWFDHSRIVLNGCEFYEFEEVTGTVYDMVIQYSELTFNQCILPVGGDTWINYVGSLVVHNDGAGLTAKTLIGQIERHGIVTDSHRIYWDTAAPTTGTWALGDMIYNSSPSASGYIGWVCVSAGSPGSWKTFGPISS